MSRVPCTFWLAFVVVSALSALLVVAFWIDAVMARRRLRRGPVITVAPIPRSGRS